jgi:hypothetical protein
MKKSISRNIVQVQLQAKAPQAIYIHSKLKKKWLEIHSFLLKMSILGKLQLGMQKK